MSVADSEALLNDGTDSVGATTSGSFDINGTAIVYDITADSLDGLRDTINTAAISGVTASVISDGEGGFQLQIRSTETLLTIDNDSGDLLSSLSLSIESYLIESANINGSADGADDGSVTIYNTTITATDTTTAEGLKFLYTGTASASGIQLDFTTGVAAQMMFEVERIVDPQTGTIANESSALADQNEAASARIEQMLLRLELQRQQLLDKFIAMETALATMNSIMDAMRQTFEALSNRNN